MKGHVTALTDVIVIYTWWRIPGWPVLEEITPELLRKDPGFIHIRGSSPSFSCMELCLSPRHGVKQRERKRKKQPSCHCCPLKRSSTALFPLPPYSRQFAFYFSLSKYRMWSFHLKCNLVTSATWWPSCTLRVLLLRFSPCPIPPLLLNSRTIRKTKYTSSIE